MLGRPFVTLLLCGALLFIGCEITETLSGSEFGDPYALAHTMSATTIAPRLDVEGLHVSVQYSGGCTVHYFKARYRSHDDTTEIWLEHDGNGDRCEGYTTETQTHRISTEVLDTEHVLLLAPDGSVVPLR